MEREIVELRQRLAKSDDPDQDDFELKAGHLSHSPEENYEDAQSSPGNPLAQSRPVAIQPQPPPSRLAQESRPAPSKDEWCLEDVALPRTRVVRLFDQSVSCHLTCLYVCSNTNTDLVSFATTIHSYPF